MGLAGLFAGAVATLVADRWAFKVFLGAMLGPALAGILLLEHRRLENATLVLILAFAGFMWREHERAYGTLVQVLRTERRLRNRERQLAEAQAIAHVGSWQWDLATAAVTWSDEQCRKVGEDKQQTLLREHETALAEVKTPQGLIEIGASCKGVLTEQGGWEQFESYVRGNSDVGCSHGI